MSWYEVLPVSALNDKEMKVIEVSGKRSVVKVGSDFFHLRRYVHSLSLLLSQVL